MVTAWAEGLHAIEEATGVATGLEKIHSFQPDIVMLDVEMDDGTGFDLLKQLQFPSFQLIFTTAHNQYAIQAFKFSAIDYLLKPIDPVDLQMSLQKAIANINSNTLQHQLAVMMQQLSIKPETDRQIVLKDIDKTYFVKMSDILYCEAEGSYTKFYLVNNEPIFVSRNLRSYEELLSPAGFIRTHHSCLVNPAKIKIYDRKTDSGTLILEGGHTIPVSQRKKDFVLQFLEKKG
jgi:two-component system LytT family response regulator